VQVRAGVPYRLWLHVRRGSHNMKTVPGILWVQFDSAVDKEGRPLYPIGTKQALAVRGTRADKWIWSGKDLGDAAATEPLLYFKASGDVTVRITSGVGGAAFDQFVLSPLKYLEKPPADFVVPKPK
jgi:hypothetical protein